MILSDMCPPVSGITTKDAALSVELGMQAVDLAVGGAASAYAGGDTEPNELSDSACGADDNGILQAGGHLLVKLLESEDIQGGINFYVDNHYCVLQCVSDFPNLFDFQAQCLNQLQVSSVDKKLRVE